MLNQKTNKFILVLLIMNNNPNNKNKHIAQVMLFAIEHIKEKNNQVKKNKALELMLVKLLK